MTVKKLLLAFSLCLAMVAALLAFDAGLLTSFRQQDLYGSWLTDIPAAEQIEASLSQFGITYDVADDLVMTYEFCYGEDGTLTVFVEQESAKELAAVQVEALRAGLPDMVYTQYQTEANLTREETDAMLAAQGLTMETLVEASLSQVDFEAQYSSETTTILQYYCVENGKLCYAASPIDLAAGNYDMTVEPRISGNALILSNALDKDGVPYLGNGVIKYPLTLTRK